MSEWSFDLFSTYKTFAVEFVGENDTVITQNVQTWMTSVMWSDELPRLVALNGNKLSGKTVLELGAGTGILTLLALRCASRVDATDYDDTELALIKSNLTQFAIKPGVGRAVKLDWNFPQRAEGLLPRYDMIFGSMLCYRKDSLLPIMATIAHFLSRYGLCFLQNSAVAQDTTYDECWCLLQEGLAANGLVASDVYADPGKFGFQLPPEMKGLRKSSPERYLLCITWDHKEL